jgi:hypothetical protein
MYVVIHNKAIALDELSQPIICDMHQSGHSEYVDWDSQDSIDWLDLSPNTYKIYKSAVDLLNSHSNEVYYIK